MALLLSLMGSDSCAEGLFYSSIMAASPLGGAIALRATHSEEKNTAPPETPPARIMGRWRPSVWFVKNAASSVTFSNLFPTEW